MEVKKKMLGIDKVHMYDLYAPLVKNLNVNIPFEEGVEIVLNGLKPLGEEYIKLLKTGFASRWIDVYENQGKTSGAYSWGSYSTNPYVLLNYSNTLSDVSTIAHEMGHSVHSYLTRKEQPYIYSEYTLFCAEVASTTNEALLVDYLLKTTSDKNMRIYILAQHLEEIRTTVYRQTMFAEFEKIIHEKAESGEALTKELLCSLWHDLNSKYYGPDVVIDEGIDMEWTRISHFYWNFYVYKYVTGYAAAMSLSKKITEEGKDAVKRYFEFLKSGDSDYSINLLKKAGVDMTTPEPLVNTINVFEKLLDQIESELK
jgi:oligoendopeptidase F